MVVTGRAALVALMLTPPVALVAHSVSAVLVVNVVLAVVLAVDAWLAGSPRTLTLTRSGATTTRLGEEAVVTLTMRNNGSRDRKSVV